MRRVVLASIPTLLLASMTARAEVLVRWRQGDLPPREALGARTVVVPADGALARDALGKGYRVYLHSDPAGVSAVAAKARASGAAGVAVVGSGPIPKDLPVPAIQVDDSGKWPRIRSNVRGRRSQVVQAANRTGQPWLDNNVAQLRILQAAGRRPVLTYPWKPDTPADARAGPATDDFATAVAEAGAFDADLLLDLDTTLLPAWAGARRYLDYYARKDSSRLPMANVGVVTRDPTAWYEVLNLMARHNVPYRILGAVESARADDLDLVILTEPGTDAPELPAERVLRAGNDAADPNGFALKVWNRLGRKRRLVDVWNGITVLVGLERGAGERALRLELVNYSAQPLPVQLRVRGIYGRIECVTPERPPQSLPFEHLDGCTEFVVPELRIGGTVALRPE